MYIHTLVHICHTKRYEHMHTCTHTHTQTHTHKHTHTQTHTHTHHTHTHAHCTPQSHTWLHYWNAWLSHNFQWHFAGETLLFQCCSHVSDCSAQCEDGTVNPDTSTLKHAIVQCSSSLPVLSDLHWLTKLEHWECGPTCFNNNNTYRVCQTPHHQHHKVQSQLQSRNSCPHKCMLGGLKNLI